MVNSVLDSVKNTPRTLQYRDRTDDSFGESVPWIITYGPGFFESRNFVRDINRSLAACDTWKDRPTEDRPQVKIVARRAPSLKDTLFKRRALALGCGFAPTVPCTPPDATRRGPRCQTCALTSGVDWLKSNDRRVRTKGGNCKTRNIIYAAQCLICSSRNTYVGKSVTSLSMRVNGHRSSFYKILRNPSHLDPNGIDDTNVLGAHLIFEHGASQQSEFNSSFKFSIISSVDPPNLRKFEQFYIDKLKSKYPYGLNRIDSVQSNP